MRLINPFARRDHDRETDLLPSERKSGRPPLPGEEERRDVDLVISRWKDAAEHRREWEIEAVLAVAMFEGRQWLEWDSAVHRARSLMAPKESKRYVTHNLIRPLVSKSTALVTLNQPEIGIAPATDAEIDRMGVAEGRVLLADQKRKWGRTMQTLQTAMWANLTGVGFALPSWDPFLHAPVPKFRVNPETGQLELAGRMSAPIGDVRLRIIPPFEIYMDPYATCWEDVRWIIRASLKPLDWFPMWYGKQGEWVEGDHRDVIDSYTSPYMANGDSGGASSLSPWGGRGEKRAALCLEMLEKPGASFDEGRWVVVGGDRLMHKDTWPFKQMEFPYVRLPYQEAVGHPYGLGLVRDLAPINIALNRLLTKILTHIEDSKHTMIRERGASNDRMSDVGIEEFRNWRELHFKKGFMPPQWVPTPQMGMDPWKYIDISWLHMQHIAGIHDVNMGGGQGGALSGITVALLQEGDKSQHAPTTRAVERYSVEVADRTIQTFAENAHPLIPRLMANSEAQGPDEARYRAQSFQALTSGGSVDLHVTEGSATPRSPAERLQQVIEFYNLGWYGMPGTPDALIAVVRAAGLAESNQMIENIRAQAEAAMAAQAQIQPPGAEEALMLEQRIGMEEAAKLDADLARGKQKHDQDMEKELYNRVLANALPDVGPG